MNRASSARERESALESRRATRRQGAAQVQRARALSILDAPPARRTTRAIAAGSFGSVTFHLGLVGLAIQFAALHPAPAPRATPVTQLFDVALQPPSPPPATPELPPTAAEPPRKPVAKASRTPAKPTATPSVAEPPPAAAEPPPAAAATGKLLEAAEPIDFGDQFVAGDRGSFAGGVSAAGGSSNRAVHDVRAQPNGVPGASGTGPDLSRAPQLADGLRWDIPFPMEADDASVDHAKVTLRVSVAADGRVANVEVLRDPGFGFGREARRFALTRRWSAGRDRTGNPIATTTTVNVSFDR